MDKAPSTPRRPTRGRPRAHLRDATSLRAPRQTAASLAGASEPPPKRRRYIAGGSGGGGRYAAPNGGVETPASTAGPATAPRTRAAAPSLTTPSNPQRERSARIRTAVNRDPSDDVPHTSAAAVAAAVVQSEGYKPREERGWEEFHPNLDIEGTFMVFHADDVDGTAKTTPPTPTVQNSDTPNNGASTPSKEGATVVPDASETPIAKQKPALETPFILTPRRRVGRPPRDPVAFYGSQISSLGLTPKTPKVLPIHNQTPKERLDLKLPSYRKTDRILLFESKTFGQARYVDKSMMNVGYQESDNFIRPERNLLKATDVNVDEDLDPGALSKADGNPTQSSAGGVGRVEYDMDEQDDMWLEKLNAQRRAGDLAPITREIFEITITKIEKEWHALEKRIPKPNPKPPQTHRPRSSSAAAVNGEPQAGEEQDSKCAICDDGDCENTNAIVFCDGCDLAVHQECYGVPFIPEGQWLCRKCQLIGRGVPTCIFCPNTDGAFKQTNSSKWAHLLCAMWIPEVSLGNHTFMEPVMEVEKVPKNRWKLTCYICDQRMGACIQCSNKNCYQAFHVTCARRGRLYLKMKNSQGALAVLDGSTLLKAFCDKHCPQDYAKENSVALATKQAKRFYKRTMKGRIWVDNQASAAQLAAAHRHAITEHPPDESQMTGVKVSAVLADKKKGQPGKPVWKLPSGAPVIPQAVYDIVEGSLQRFLIAKRKDFVGEACRYWTLKREARRGAALLKRLQLQMDTFSSMELTRRNFAAMGPSGKARLTRRIEFARGLVEDMERLKSLSEHIVQREASKLEAADMELDFVDSCYFPVYKMLIPVIEKAFTLDKDVFKEGLSRLQSKLECRYYTTTLAFAHDLCEVIHVGINAPVKPAADEAGSQPNDVAATPRQNANLVTRDRKRLGKRILKFVQPQLEAALKAEADISNKPLGTLVKELEGMLEASLETSQRTITVANEDGHDVTMADASEEGQIVVADQDDAGARTAGDPGAEGVAVSGVTPDANAELGDKMDVDGAPGQAEGSVDVAMSEAEEAGNSEVPASTSVSVAGDKPTDKRAGRTKNNSSSPSLNGYASTAAAVAAQQQQQPHQAAGPLTPPQSNGSLGHGVADALSDGGLPWYLKGFDLVGTTATDEQWAGREAVRNLSEELTDLDDEALRDLEFDVDEDNNNNTITASPVNPGAKTEDAPAPPTPSPSKKRAAPAKLRKSLRSSTRRR